MDSIAKAASAHRDFFRQGHTRSVGFRLEYLHRLRKSLLRHEDDLYEAFWQDLRKPKMETFATEIGILLKEIRHHVKKLKKWAKPTRVPTDLLNFYATSRIIHEPYGVVMIMSPWNYPLQLSLLPLIGAISAGNCALVKPAHYSARVSDVIRMMIHEAFPSEYVSVFTGNRQVNQAILDQRFDLIFFTGSIGLGKIVMEKAAKYLTPVVLELGGKSPCIVERDADIAIAAQRIAFGKFLNAGQTCIAPDHLFVHSSVKKPLIDGISSWIEKCHGKDPEKSPDYGRIINHAQVDRLDYLMRSGGTIVCGGKVDRQTRYVAPTLIDNIKINDPIMQEEIFGPLLPVIEFRRLEQVIETINRGEKPLAMYVFTDSKSRMDRILSCTSSGGGCINDTIMHVANPSLPFGGVGHSGMGMYHGQYSFNTFSHHRSILKKTTRFNTTVPYPPYKNKLRFVRWMLS
ncbi:MAG: aldehyde dehydrogenase [Desulfatitalea sp.]|nr:aldehyde dehydrogenase [Desulfatitalea sp.]NNJ98805.1 aldehyde dehydrogenase [Desulfatitalea sp.]